MGSRFRPFGKRSEARAGELDRECRNAFPKPLYIFDQTFISMQRPKQQTLIVSGWGSLFGAVGAVLPVGILPRPLQTKAANRSKKSPYIPLQVNFDAKGPAEMVLHRLRIIWKRPPDFGQHGQLNPLAPRTFKTRRRNSGGCAFFCLHASVFNYMRIHAAR